MAVKALKGRIRYILWAKIGMAPLQKIWFFFQANLEKNNMCFSASRSLIRHCCWWWSLTRESIYACAYMLSPVRLSRKRYEIWPTLLLMTNRNLHMHLGRWPWMALNCYKFKFSRNFALLRIFGRPLKPMRSRAYLCVSYRLSSD